jgi:hypothetical protein
MVPASLSASRKPSGAIFAGVIPVTGVSSRISEKSE